MRNNLTDKFPTEDLNNYLAGRDFVRTSPITGAKAYGTVKKVSVIYGDEYDSNYKIIINVLSTNDVAYDYNELSFKISDSIEKREKIISKIREEEEQKKINDMLDI